MGAKRTRLLRRVKGCFGRSYDETCERKLLARPNPYFRAFHEISLSPPLIEHRQTSNTTGWIKTSYRFDTSPWCIANIVGIIVTGVDCANDTQIALNLIVIIGSRRFGKIMSIHPVKSNVQRKNNLTGRSPYTSHSSRNTFRESTITKTECLHRLLNHPSKYYYVIALIVM